MDNNEMAAAQQVQAVPRPRIANACEACRSAKVKCQASNQLGICKRCFDSKRECIFKTGPRTRRPRYSKLSENSPRPPPPPGPSRTFTIDIPMPDDGVHDVAEGIDALRLAHEVSIDELAPYASSDEADPDDEMLNDYDYDYSYSYYETPGEGQNRPRRRQQQSTTGSVISNASSLPLGASALSTPPSSAGGRSNALPQGQGKKSLATIGIQPQFNVDSATALLESFKTVMMRQFPVLLMTEDATVATLAKERPFVLLAVLAAASSSRSLQGHSLYDEEFRKILGLKFVAGGERSVELLLGLVIYVAWYPFHLRPRNKQAFQYVRMTVDIVNDLELDQDSYSYLGMDELSPERLEEIRAYLGSYYLVSNYGTSWNRTPSLQWSPYTAKCCDIIDLHAQSQGDKILAWQVRLQRIVEETNDMRQKGRGHSQSESQIDLMLKGMEAQLVEWERRLPEELTSITSIRLGFTFPRLFLSGAPLLKFLSTKPAPLESKSYFHADPTRLSELIPTLQAAWDYYLTLPAIQLNSFTGVYWNNFIVSIILGFRMSFPLAVCPEWDDKSARAKLRFDEYVERFCRNWGGEETGDSDEILERLKASLGTGSGQPGHGNGNGNTTAANTTRNLDILSASKVVLDIVKKKYFKKLAKFEPRPPPPLLPTAMAGAAGAGAEFNVNHSPNSATSAPLSRASPRRGHPESASPNCPMIDGSMEAFYPFFDETFPTQLVPPLPVGHPPIRGPGPGPVPVPTSQPQSEIYHSQRHLQQQQQPPPPPTPAMGILAGLGLGIGEQGANMGPAPTVTTAGEVGEEGLLVDDGGFSNELWATMTMNWAGQNDMAFDDM